MMEDVAAVAAVVEEEEIGPNDFQKMMQTLPDFEIWLLCVDGSQSRWMKGAPAYFGGSRSRSQVAALVFAKVTRLQ